MSYTPDPPHPLGGTYAERIEAWKLIQMFGGPGGPGDVWAQIADLALRAGEAQTDEELQRLAVQALGLNGSKRAYRNQQALREALGALSRIVDGAWPSPDPFGDEDELPPAPEGSEARLQWEAVAAVLPTWLYERVKGNTYGEEDTHVRFLQRTAADDSDLKRQLEWALRMWRANRPPNPNPHKRGRIR
jgi:hypothetical protein